MSLDYFLLCRQKYDRIIKQLDYVISLYQDICDNTNNEDLDNPVTQIDFELYNPEYNKRVFIEKKQCIEKIKNLCDVQIIKLCDHHFITDSIDITPERSQTIQYCSICEYTVYPPPLSRL